MLHCLHAGFCPTPFHSIARTTVPVTRDETERDTAPTSPPATSRSPTENTKPPTQASSLHRLVHVIGDSEEIHALLGMLTSRRPDTHVQCFASGEAFLDQLATLEPGVVLLDFDLPGIDGMDVLTRVRCLTTPFPMIIRSKRHSIAVAVEAMKLGALDFTEKAHDPKSLFAAIEDGFGVIENARALRERPKIAGIGDADDAPINRVGA